MASIDSGCGMGVAVGDAVNVEVGGGVCVGGGGVEVAEATSLVGKEALLVVLQELKSRNPVRRMKFMARNFFMPLRRFFLFDYYSLAVSHFGLNQKALVAARAFVS